ncbi:unnamed protein product [Vitrella brassicaformis CCMP3155]|uniref:Uncharacterized protein n=1 Tax=Vitrella brassicaformis (strain CCMP3155) TaxID=1169540 RepID=A0A0G4E881_VITBC|nr:unnamed protein product [Vitrella brassicaformis CCMP3155]|eukprot:CEL91790.1 unnamed protein product [Vitrella brassicaformis CCMP3155]
MDMASKEAKVRIQPVSLLIAVAVVVLLVGTAAAWGGSLHTETHIAEAGKAGHHDDAGAVQVCRVQMTRKHTTTPGAVNFFYLPHKMVDPCTVKEGLNQICAVYNTGPTYTEFELDFYKTRPVFRGKCIDKSTAEEMCGEQRVVEETAEQGGMMCTLKPQYRERPNLAKATLPEGSTGSISGNYSATAYVVEGDTETAYNFYLPGSKKWAEWADKPFAST